MEITRTAPKYTTYLTLPFILLGCVEDNVAPEAVNDSATLPRGGSVVIQVLENDSDEDDDPLEVTNLSTPENGRITLQADGSVLYQHDGSDTSQDSFTYTAFDGAADSNTAEVTLTIEYEDDPGNDSKDDEPGNDSKDDEPGNDSEDTPPPPTTTDNQRPIARNDHFQMTQGESRTLNLLHNDEDPDSDQLQIITLTEPHSGRIQLQTDGVTVVYQHDGSDTTEDNFTYIVSDGKEQSRAAQVSVTFTAVNHAPEFTRPGSNGSIPVDALYSLKFEANDPDGDDLSYSVDGLPYWLVYSPSSNMLSGSPSWEDLGNSYIVVISASDGTTTTENSFTLRVSEAQSVTDNMAFRLLQQSTFGPVLSEIKRVKNLGISGWIDFQLSMNSAYTSPSDGWKTHLERTEEIAQQAEPSVSWFSNNQVFNKASTRSTVRDYQMAAWWENVLSATTPQRTQIGSDQLRQRVAYALSQLLVVSTSTPSLSIRGESLAAYYDLLVEHAFGNYRDLLGKIAISPAMGVYLSHQGNRKADPSTGSRPDENFSREIIQLFSIGLYELNLDGTPNRDGNSNSYPDTGTNTVPTYTQSDIEELAKVMTGWDLAGNDRFGRLNNGSGDYTQPMVFHPSEHEDEAAEGGDGNITLLGVTFPLNSGSDQSGLDKALDTLFAHPNVAPYVSKHLIQRLVTSNPTSNYVARIARVFNNNGEGVKGDLKAVIRAILLDPEARDDSYRTNPAFGKAKEPLLAITQLLRATHVAPLDGWRSRENIPMNHVYWFRNPENYLNQGAMRSPSVFNFYNPHHVPSDNYFASHQLAGPEFQIETSQMLVDYNNLVYQLLSKYEKNRIINLNDKSISEFSATRNHYNLSLLTNFDTELTLVEQALEGDSNGDFSTLGDNTLDNNGNTPKSRAVDALIDHLDLTMLGRTMSDEYRAALKHYLLSSSYTNISNKPESIRRMAQDAFTMIATCSDYMIQK